MPEYKGTIKSKLPKAGTTIFAIMSALANEHTAINLSQGFPGFNVSAELIDLIHQKMKEGHNQYAPMPGILSLREQIAEKVKLLYAATYNPESEITITSGGTQAIYTAITAVVHEGDEVIVFEPAYDSYVPAIELAGGIPIHLHLKNPDYHIDWDEVKKFVNPKTRMIMINTPHNPTGAILTGEDMKELEKITHNSDILVLSDEVYEHIIFDGHQHESVMRYPELAERSFVVFSFGKTYHATGWKMGYVLAPEKLMKEFRRVHQFNVFSANTPIQHAFAGYMREKKHYTALNSFYQKKRNFFLEQMEGSRFKALPCSGSYFQLMDYSEISDEKDTEFAKRVTVEYGVASIPVSVFYNSPPDEKLLRFCFAKDDQMLKHAAEKLKKV